MIFFDSLKSVVQDDPKLEGLVEDVEQAATLVLLVLAALQLGRAIAVKAVEEILNERGQAKEDECIQCGKCKAKLESKGLLPREILTLIGWMKWKRRVRRCPEGCEGSHVAPSDEVLGLNAYQKTSLEVKWLGSALAIFVPFEIAAVLLAMLTGVKVDGKSIWNWVQERGKMAMEQLEGKLSALEAGELSEVELKDTALKTLPLLIGADGVMVPFRPNGGSPEGKTKWREVKVGILTRLGERANGAKQLVQRRLAAFLGPVDDFAPRLWLEAVKQGVKEAKCVAWLSDGGRGYWGVYDKYFADYATGILDFYHAAQNLWKGAKAGFDGRTSTAKQWFAKNRRRLRKGKVDDVLNDIEAALALEGLPSSAHQTLTNLYLYLNTHSEHIDYAQFEKLGLPLGSGMVESACKWLIQQRFKGVGMRWSEEGFNNLLHLRLAWVNGRYDQLFAF
jgi:hypothetical protein